MPLPVPTNEDPRPLWEEIRRFSRRKYGWALILLVLALLGIVIPVLPGVLFLMLAIAIIRPGMMARVRKMLNRFWKR
ncbi:MAG: hypothetical protein D6677_09315 [Calditrichaeota bacterium]|nr:MAG: hypothetical protein D6677_09315 [Calditrichota bacterium]